MAKIIKILFGSFIILSISAFSFLLDNKVFAAGCDVDLIFTSAPNVNTYTKDVNFTVKRPLNRPASCPQIYNVELSKLDGSNYLPITGKTISVDLTRVESVVDSGQNVTYSISFTGIESNAVYGASLTDYNGTVVKSISSINLNNTAVTPPTASSGPPTTGGGTGSGSTGGGGGTGGAGGTPAGSIVPAAGSTLTVGAAEGEVKRMVTGLYYIALAIAILIAIIKLILAIMKIAISSGDPNTLNEAKDEAYATLMGLLVIAGAVTLITMLGKALGL